MPASPFASRGSGRPIQMDKTAHSAEGNPTGAPGPHATAAYPPIEATRPIDEGDDGFTSGGTTSTDHLRRLDVASAPSAPQSRLATRPIAARRSPTPSLSQRRSELRSPDSERAGLASFVGARIARNGSDQWLAAHGQPSPTTMPASPFASRGSGRPIQMDWTDHSVEGNSTGASGPHATAASPLLEATRPIDEGGD
jgi:hypothetical protein